MARHSDISPAQMSSAHAELARLSQPLAAEPGSFPLIGVGQRLQQAGMHPISLLPSAHPGTAVCRAMQPRTGLSAASSMTGLGNQPLGRLHQCMEKQHMTGGNLQMADQHLKPGSSDFAAFGGGAGAHRWPGHVQEAHGQQGSAHCKQALGNILQVLIFCSCSNACGPGSGLLA